MSLTSRDEALALARGQLEGVNRYCFAHVPRTGGSALLDFLFTNLGNDFVLDTFVESKRFSIFAELRDSGSFQREFASHRFLHIHVPVQIQRYLEPEKVACFTVLRHPFDRIVSYYEWSRKIYRDTQNEQFGCRPEVSLESFIESKMDDISVFNIYTYFFACLVDEGVVRHDVWRSIIVAPPKDAYALALEALRSFYLTAPLEELANAAAILAAIHEPEFLARQQATGGRRAGAAASGVSQQQPYRDAPWAALEPARDRIADGGVPVRPAALRILHEPFLSTVGRFSVHEYSAGRVRPDRSVWPT